MHVTINELITTIYRTPSLSVYSSNGAQNPHTTVCEHTHVILFMLRRHSTAAQYTSNMAARATSVARMTSLYPRVYVSIN